MLYVYVDDVDALHQRALEARAKIVQTLEDRAWGDRSFQATDPQGHQWVFAQQEVASPDLLEAHLAQLFPGSYQPPTADNEGTEFTNLKSALNRSWWKKSLGVG